MLGEQGEDGVAVLVFAREDFGGDVLGNEVADVVGFSLELGVVERHGLGDGGAVGMVDAAVILRVATAVGQDHLIVLLGGWKAMARVGC